MCVTHGRSEQKAKTQNIEWKMKMCVKNISITIATFIFSLIKPSSPEPSSTTTESSSGEIFCVFFSLIVSRLRDLENLRFHSDASSTSAANHHQPFNFFPMFFSHSSGMPSPPPNVLSRHYRVEWEQGHGYFV